MSIAEGISAPLRVGLFVAFSMAVMTLGCSTGGPRAIAPIEDHTATSADAIDINTADELQLERLPDIGPRIAQRIIEHRVANGRFRRPEHLMLVDGISETRFRSIRHLIRTD
jgi:competence protein ComEA